MPTALILIDLQYDFLPGGTLAVPGGDEVVPIASALIPKFDCVIATQDWHPSGHESFASSHPGQVVGDVIDLHGLPQVLWPDHCIQGTHGAELAHGLDRDRIQTVIRKGQNPQVDSYSGFFDNGHREETRLHSELSHRRINRVYLMGLATDYCVKYTALDARKLNFETHLILPGCRAVNLQPHDERQAIDEMQQQGVIIHRDVTELFSGPVTERS